MDIGVRVCLKQWRNRRGGGAGGQSTSRDFPRGIFCRVIGKNEARKKVLKMENVEENEEKWKREGGKKEKNGKGRRKMRKNGKGKE